MLGNPKTDSSTIVLFGSTGDLARKKLYPAMYHLFQENLMPQSFAVIGLGRRQFTNEQFREIIEQSIADSEHNIDDRWTEFVERFTYFALDVNRAEDYQGLLGEIEQKEQEYNIQQNRLFYLAIAPELFGSVSFYLKDQGLLNNTGWRRLIIEKPFGKNAQSAQELNDKINHAFSEEEVYRIDHYLGKEMVQNIEVIRFANSFFEPVWNNKYISNVQITLSESVGVGTRGGYYDKAGALQDMVQNHILQIVTMLAMEPPNKLDPEAVRDEKVKVLRAIRKWETAEDVRNNVIRGQYAAGQLDGRHVPAYLDEEQIAANSQTETYVAAKLWIDNDRWENVPFFIRTGKSLAKKATEIVIEFKQLPNLYFNTSGGLDPNLLVIRIYPEEGVHLQLNAKKPGTDGEIGSISMNFCHNEHGEYAPEAYELLIRDCLEGVSTYFTRWDEVALAWDIVDPIAQAWLSGNVPLYYYEAGSWGPQEADELVSKENLHWWPMSDIVCSI